MGGVERRSLIAGSIVGGALLGVVALGGPGGLHGLAYWSSPPLARVQGAAPDLRADAAAATSAEVGAVSGQVTDQLDREPIPGADGAVSADLVRAQDEGEVAPRLPLGEEPLPALPYAMQERVYRAYQRPALDTTVAQVDDVPPLPVEPLPSPAEERQAIEGEPAPAQDPEAPAAAPEALESGAEPEAATPQEGTRAEISRLARLAGAEMARGFLDELQRQAPSPAADGAPATEEEAVPLEAEEDELEAPAEDEGAATTAAPTRPEEEEFTQREQIVLEATATATALQNALIPLLAGQQGLAPPVAPPVQTPPINTPPMEPPAGTFPNQLAPSPAQATADPMGGPPTTELVPPTGAPTLPVTPGAPIPGTGSTLSATPMPTGPATGGVSPNTIAPGSIIPAPATGAPTMTPGTMAPGTVVPGMTPWMAPGPGMQ